MHYSKIPSSSQIGNLDIDVLLFVRYLDLRNFTLTFVILWVIYTIILKAQLYMNKQYFH